MQKNKKEGNLEVSEVLYSWLIYLLYYNTAYNYSVIIINERD